MNKNEDTLDFSIDPRGKGKELRSVSEYVKSIITPFTSPELEDLRNKPSALMYEDELALCQHHLREDLKRANKFLTRVIEKTLVLKTGEEKGRKNAGGKDKAISLLQREIDNCD